MLLAFESLMQRADDSLLFRTGHSQRCLATNPSVWLDRGQNSRSAHFCLQPATNRLEAETESGLPGPEALNEVVQPSQTSGAKFRPNGASEQMIM